MEKIYTITTMYCADDELCLKFRKRCWGWYSDVDRANLVAIENQGDVFESGCYNYAVVEEYPMGMWHIAKQVTWFKANFEGSHLKSVDVLDGPPAWSKHTCNYSMG